MVLGVRRIESERMLAERRMLVRWLMSSFCGGDDGKRGVSMWIKEAWRVER